MIALLVLCGIADCVTTYIGLKRGDTEANPVAARLFRLIGPVAGMLVLKVLCTALAIFVSLHWPIAGWAFLAGYGYVLFNNVRVIRS